MKRGAKLADVAKAAGVSQGTASNVFNRPELVKAEVRERVEAAAKRLGYAGPDPKGRLLRAGKVNAIGVVIGDETAYCFQDPYTRELMAGIAEVCDQHGAGVSLISTRQRSEAGWRVQTALVDGFIVQYGRVRESFVAAVHERRLPLVSIDLDGGPGTSSVYVDDRQGAYLAARHLLELGHRDIALLALESCLPPRFGDSTVDRLRASEYRFSRERSAGYAAALAERGLALEALPIVEVPNDRTTGRRYVRELLAQQPGTTALLAMSDVIALAACDAAREAGLRVPEDLSVVGFDDVAEGAAAEPPLTTVRQPIAEKGRAAARLIFSADAPRCQVLPVELVVRGTTAPPRAAARSG
jgi:DNA-binding LacI/PurR family transcriptional regulator